MIPIRKPVGLPDFNNMMSNVQSGMYNVQIADSLLDAKFKYEDEVYKIKAFSSQTTTPNKGPPIEWSEDWSDDDYYRFIKRLITTYTIHLENVLESV